MPIKPNEIHFVMGKGGVGRSTISVLLARYFETIKQSSIIVECNGAQDIPKYYNQKSRGYEIQQLSPLISSLSITAEEAIEDYILQQLHFQKLYQLIFKNKLIEPLLQGAPGLHNAVHLGKIYDLAGMKENEKYQFDHIIVDSPATGHGLQILTAAKTMMNLAKVGPLFESNRIVEERLQERANIVIVTLPEELPCRETKELWKNLDQSWKQKTKLFFINKNEIFEELYHFNIPQNQRADFPEHQKRLEEWVSAQKERHQWQQWIKKELPLPYLNIARDEFSRLQLSEDFQATWGIKP